MSVSTISTDLPAPVQAQPVWLDMCGWNVPAGFPSPAADHAQKRIDINAHLIRNKDATFLFRVRGDSMTGVGIYEGDTLVVDRSVEPKHNHIVLAVIHNEFTVKRLYRRGGVVKLLAENPIYPPRLIKPEEELLIWGVVTFNLHKLC
ncbi:MAG: LexA repressor [Pseudomonadota bacterium]|jgi:DNA polymerase V